MIRLPLYHANARAGFHNSERTLHCVPLPCHLTSFAVVVATSQVNKKRALRGFTAEIPQLYNAGEDSTGNQGALSQDEGFKERYQADTTPYTYTPRRTIVCLAS